MATPVRVQTSKQMSAARAAVVALQAERSAAIGTAVALEVKLLDARLEADRERATVVDLRAVLSAAEVRRALP